MRILITTFTFAPQRNGVAGVAGAQASGLAVRGHQITIATGFDPARAGVVLSDNPRVVEFKLSDTTQPADEVRRYQDFIANFPADIILCHCWRSWPTDLAVAALPRNPARKILVSHGYSAHKWTPNKKFAWGLGQWLKAQPYVWSTPRKLRAFDHLVFLSAKVDWDRFFDHRLVNWLGGPPWSAIPNGAFLPKPENPAINFREKYGIGKEFLMLYVSAYGDGKNQLMALRSFLQARLPGAVMIFIGNELNDYAQELKRQRDQFASGNGAGKVLFLEKLSPEVIQAAYQSADLFVMSSKAESQPLVLLDAMAVGLPFLSTDVGCVSDLPGGVLVRNERELSEAMKALFSDPSRRQRLSQAGRQACHVTYNWEQILADYERLFQRLLTVPVPG